MWQSNPNSMHKNTDFKLPNILLQVQAANYTRGFFSQQQRIKNKISHSAHQILIEDRL